MTAASQVRQVFSTTLQCECGGSLEILVNPYSGRCMVVCPTCVGEVGCGSRLEENPGMQLSEAAERFLGGIRS